MRRLPLALLISAAVLTAACGGNGTNTGTDNRIANANTAATPAPAATAPPDEFAAARATFEDTCVRCHKEDGEGGQVQLDEQTRIKVPSLRRGHALNHTDAQLARTIAKGDPDEGMPSFEKRLTPEQIDALVRFIRHEFQGGATSDGAPKAPAGRHE